MLLENILGHFRENNLLSLKMWSLQARIIILLVCFVPIFDPNSTFDLKYFENYPVTFH